MTSDGDALFRAICEQPWEDTPRLAYADWLEEHGQLEWAELVRLGVEIVRQEDGWEALSAEQSRRLDALKSVRTELLRGLPSIPGIRWVDEFDRGFPCRVTATSATAFLKNAEAIYRAAPVTRLKTSNLSRRTIEELPRSPYLERLRVLDLTSAYSGDVGPRPLANSPHVRRLVVLKLARTGVTDAGVIALAKSPHFAELDYLDISHNAGVTDVGALALANAPRMTLTDVDVAGTRVGPEGYSAIQMMSERNYSRSRRPEV